MEKSKTTKLETAEAHNLSAGVGSYKSVDLGPNSMREFGYKDGWNSGLDEAIKTFAGEENWKLNIRKVLEGLKK